MDTQAKKSGNKTWISKFSTKWMCFKKWKITLFRKMYNVPMVVFLYEETITATWNNSLLEEKRI